MRLTFGLATICLAVLIATDARAWHDLPRVPDTEMAYSDRDVFGAAGISVANLAGDSVRRFVDATHEPAIAPSGRWLAWHAYGFRQGLASYALEPLATWFDTSAPCGTNSPAIAPDSQSFFFRRCTGEIWSSPLHGAVTDLVCRIGAAAGAVDTPAISPDGSLVAYSLSVPGDLERSGIYERSATSTCSDQSPGRQLVSQADLPQGGSVPGQPAYSPQGDTVAFNTAYKDLNGLIGLVARDDGDVTFPVAPDDSLDPINPLATALGYPGPATDGTVGASPVFSPDGDRILAIRPYSSDPLATSGKCSQLSASSCKLGVFSMELDGTDPRFLAGDLDSVSAEGHAGSLRVSVVGPDDSSEDLGLLHRFAPVLRYSSGEQYFFDSAAIITDAPGTKLVDPEGAPIVDHSAGRYGRLSLQTLHSAPYTTDFSPSTQEAHLLDEADDDREATAAQFHSSASYANRTYGRVVRVAGGERILQYWFFAYYNDSLLPLTGDHEGDWEMMQLRLRSDGAPAAATFSAHEDQDATTCHWNALELAHGTHPYAYVALGSHGIYGHSGSFPTETTVGPLGQIDHADGLGSVASPSIGFLDGVGWEAWPGQWGGDARNAGPEYDIVGPVHQGLRWDDPVAYEQQARPCVPALDGGRSHHSRGALVGGRTRVSADIARRRPRAPRVRALRVRDHLIVRIRVARARAKGPRPKVVRIALLVAGPTGPSTRVVASLRTPKEWRRGVVFRAQDLPSRPLVQATAVTRFGVPSRPAMTRAQRGPDRQLRRLRALTVKVPPPFAPPVSPAGIAEVFAPIGGRVPLTP